MSESASRRNGVLGSVRQLEGALEATSTTRAASEKRLEEARAAASRLLAAARENAAAAAAERRRVALAAAEDDAAEISRRGEETRGPPACERTGQLRRGRRGRPGAHPAGRRQERGVSTCSSP